MLMEAACKNKNLVKGTTEWIKRNIICQQTLARLTRFIRGDR